MYVLLRLIPINPLIHWESAVINSERAALKTSVFSQKLEHTRQKMLEDVAERIKRAK